MGSNRHPLISVVIPCYNAASYVAAAIDSVLNQNYSNLQIIVVDDGSADDSKNVICRYGDRVQYMFQQNGGISAARNAALKKVRGDLVAFWTPMTCGLKIV